MNHENLATHLKDHLAGSSAAIELLDHLLEESEEASSRILFKGPKDEIEGEQQILHSLINTVEGGAGMVRKAAGWISEKAAWLKLKGAGLQLGRFRSLEALMIGITGKRALWILLSSLNCFPDQNFPKLIQNTEKQLDPVERCRLDEARSVFV